MTSTWYPDADADGYGGTVATDACSAPAGHVATSGDCDGTADDDAIDADTWYLDADADGWGVATTVLSCSLPTGYAASSGDCDDGASGVNPGASEVCDASDTDEDCDGTADDASASGQTTWYADADVDGYGDAAASMDACDVPSGFVADDSDCDDSAADVNPAATEVCNGDDDDCEGPPTRARPTRSRGTPTPTSTATVTRARRAPRAPRLPAGSPTTRTATTPPRRSRRPRPRSATPPTPTRTADLHVTAEGYQLLLSGFDFAGADHLYAQDLAIGRWPGMDGTAIASTWGSEYVTTAGDWTGDGTNDLLVSAPASYTLGYQHGEVFVVGGDVRGDFTIGGVAVGSWVGNVEDGHLGCAGAIAADSELGDEIFIGGSDGYHVVRRELPALRTPVAGLVLTGYIIPRGPPQDLDGDGYEDWAFGDGDAGTGNIWFGWDIPWDDPTYW